MSGAGLGGALGGLKMPFMSKGKDSESEQQDRGAAEPAGPTGPGHNFPLNPFKRNGHHSHQHSRHHQEVSNIAQEAKAIGGGGGAMYFTKHVLDALPTHEFPEDAMPPEVVYAHVRDLRMFDRNPRLNLASYLTTYMEDEAQKLFMESLAVNHADASMYPSSHEMEGRCVKMLADLYHAPDPTNVKGTATIGSTEACLLGGLNMKKRWMDAQRAKGKPTDRPNLIISDALQVCWEKLSKYFDIELRLGKMSEGCFELTPQMVEELADENTIGVVAILGNTYTGNLDNVKAISEVCDKLRKERGLDLNIHVDAASGGFIVPFLFPDIEWDFRLPNVISISVSGHKYGLVYAGVGWNVWRSPEVLHKDLIFHLNYLGTQQENLTMNFSRPASGVIAQYYQLLRLGRQGYSLVARNVQQVALHIAAGLERTGALQVINDVHRTVPVVVFKFKPYDEEAPSGTLDHSEPGREVPLAPETQEQGVPEVKQRAYTVFELADKLKEQGWYVPAYSLAPNLEKTLVCRFVIREDLSLATADKLLADIKDALDWLDAHFEGRTREQRDRAVESLKHIMPNRAPSKQKHMKKMYPSC